MFIDADSSDNIIQSLPAFVFSRILTPFTFLFASVSPRVQPLLPLEEPVPSFRAAAFFKLLFATELKETKCPEYLKISFELDI